MTQGLVDQESVQREKAHQIFGMVKEFSKGADEVEVSLLTNTGEFLRFGNNELGQSQFTKSRRLAVRVTSGNRQARASTGRLERGEIQKTVQKALAQARTAPEDKDYLTMLGGSQRYQTVNRYHPRTVETPSEQKAGYVGHAIDAAKKNGLLASGVLGVSADHYTMLNSSGLEANYKGTTGYYSLTMDADNGNQTGFALSSFSDIRELDPDKVAETALSRARLNKNQTDFSPGKYDVVIDPYAWSESLFFLAVSATAGYAPDFGTRQYKEGRSYLSGRVGQEITGKKITIEDDVTHPLQSGPPFDGEGYPKSKLTMVQNGVLKDLPSSRISAHRYPDAKPTGHELSLPNPLGEHPGNMVIHGHGPTRRTAEELVKDLDKGLFITRLWYVREVEPRTKTVTGMTRDGTFWVENGEIVRPVRNLRFNQSLLDMFANAEAFTEPVRNSAPFGGSTIVQPGILAKDFNFTSVSVF